MINVVLFVVMETNQVGVSALRIEFPVKFYSK